MTSATVLRFWTPPPTCQWHIVCIRANKLSADVIYECPLKPGKLIWVVGVSCAGKSTVAQMLAKEKGYVYYEADCITMLCNPFPDLGADNLYDALMTSRPLKGWSREDAETITQYRLKFGQWMMSPEGSIMEIGTVLT